MGVRTSFLGWLLELLFPAMIIATYCSIFQYQNIFTTNYNNA